MFEHPIMRREGMTEKKWQTKPGTPPRYYGPTMTSHYWIVKRPEFESSWDFKSHNLRAPSRWKLLLVRDGPWTPILRPRSGAKAISGVMTKWWSNKFFYSFECVLNTNTILDHDYCYCLLKIVFLHNMYLHTRAYPWPAKRNNMNIKSKETI